MTAARHAREADQATIAFQVALAKIGVGSLEEALDLWQNVNPSRVEATASRWLDQAVQMILSRRGLSRDLAMAYYRLVRALRTGRTIADPREPPPPPYITLDVLRDEFAQLVLDQGVTGEEFDLPPESAYTDDGDEDTDISDEDRILIEEIRDLYEAEDELDRAAEEEARLVLENLGKRRLERELAELEEERTEQEVREAQDKAGRRQAAAAERIVLNGGRGLLWEAQGLDGKALGYVRYSTTGTPCGFCAMLISRGPVYQSAASAQFGDGDLYHDNCRCIAVPVFSRDAYERSPLFDLNRRYHDEWPRVTKGKAGKAALRAWRRWIRQQQKAQAA